MTEHPLEQHLADREHITHQRPEVLSAVRAKKRLAGKKLYVAGQVSCTSSRIYVKRYEEFILEHGGVLASQPSEADYILVDTCAVNTEKENESFDLIKKSEDMAKEDAQVIVCGCLSGMNPQALQERFKGHFFSPKNEKQLAIILGLDEEEEKFLSPLEPRGRFLGGDDYTGSSHYDRLLIRTITLCHKVNNTVSLGWIPVLSKILDCTQGGNPEAYGLTISQGCLGSCSFCVIPMAKGRTQSLSIGAIVERIRTMVVEKGVKRFVLTSEDTGAYGKDIGTNIVELLKRIHEIPSDFTIHIHFFDPRWLRFFGKALIPIFAQGRVRYIQLPLQSGSNSVLARMMRVYQIEQVLPVIEEFREKLPKLALSTQIIAGFPGETQAEFECTRTLLKKNLFHWVQVFNFSNRPGAAAVSLPGHLPQEQITKRAKILRRDWTMAKLGLARLA